MYGSAICSARTNSCFCLLFSQKEANITVAFIWMLVSLIIFTSSMALSFDILHSSHNFLLQNQHFFLVVGIKGEDVVVGDANDEEPHLFRMRV